MAKYKNLLLIGVLVLGVMVLMFVFRPANDGENYPLPAEAPTPAEVTVSDQIKGNPEATVVLVEYSDFECPACASYWPLLGVLAEMYEDDMVFVYRHFPLTNIHRNAHLAARASEAAGLQGRFWEMHDLIFENQFAWRGRNGKPFFLGYAEELGLDMDKFESDLDSEQVIEKVQSDWASGINADVGGTPTFFINGQRIQNPGSLDEFSALIEGFLNNEGQAE